MNRFLFVAIAACTLVAVASPAEAFHGRVVSRQRIVVRQQVVKQQVVQQKVVQQVVAQPVYAVPVVQQVIAQPVVLQQQVHGCSTFFVK